MWIKLNKSKCTVKQWKIFWSIARSLGIANIKCDLKSLALSYSPLLRHNSKFLDQLLAPLQSRVSGSLSVATIFANLNIKGPSFFQIDQPQGTESDLS